MPVKNKYFQAFVAVVFAFLFSHWLTYDVASLAFFLGTDGSDEDPISDYYYSVMNRRDVRQYDSSVVVVGIDGCSRSEIAAAIEEIEFCQPRVIGLDVIFPYESSEYPRLIEVIEECENIVLPLNLKYDQSTDSYEIGSANTLFYDSLSNGLYGAVNLVASDARSMVRDFRPIFRTQEEEVDNFALKIASVADPIVADNARKRGNRLETIAYSAVDFEVIKAEDILENMNLLYDKVVIVGTLEDENDVHITPIDSRMPGLMIHAYVVSMILNDNFIREISPCFNWLISMVLCYLVVLLSLVLKKSKVKSLLLRLAQAIMLYLIVLAGCYLFIKRNVYLNLAFPVMMVGLGLAAEDVCSGTYKLWNIIIKKIKRK